MGKIIEILTDLNAWSACFRIFLSVVFGGIIGFERGHHGRAAGLRTHILVCLGSTMASLVGLYGVAILGFTADPMRVGAQVISGISFLGVGTILVRNRNQVTGLTTAAGLWATAAVGLAIGIGFYVAAIGAFLAVVITMTIFFYLERSVKSKVVTYGCYIELNDVNLVNSLYDEVTPLVSSIEVIPAKSGIASHVGLELKATSYENYELLLKKARECEDVSIALPL